MPRRLVLGNRGHGLRGRDGQGGGDGLAGQLLAWTVVQLGHQLRQFLNLHNLHLPRPHLQH